MAIADDLSTTEVVKRQYELLPYPLRDPEKEMGHLSCTGLEELNMLNYYCYRGRRDFRQGFRALVAGGGTGDGSVFLAHQLSNTDAAVVHLDLSDSAIQIARDRARQRGLEEKITWIRGSLLDLPDLGLEPFDYVNCSGVLHHLDSPADGLAALASVLKEDGAMGLFVYGQYGRTGVYQMQDLMRLINHDEHDPQERIDNAKETLASLPNTNWLMRAPAMTENLDDLTDTEIYDRFLHAQDQAFTVPQLYDLLDSADLHLIEFAYHNRAMYDPRFAFRSERLARQVARLPLRFQQAAAELYWGTIHKHAFWASRRTDTVADPRNPENVPMFSKAAETGGMPESILAAASSTAQCWKPSIKGPHGITLSFQLYLNDVNRRFVRLIDGRRTMGEIVEAIVSQSRPSPDAEEVWGICCDTFETLRKFDCLGLRHVSVPGLGYLLAPGMDDLWSPPVD